MSAIVSVKDVRATRYTRRNVRDYINEVYGKLHDNFDIRMSIPLEKRDYLYYNAAMILRENLMRFQREIALFNDLSILEQNKYRETYEHLQTMIELLGKNVEV